MAAICREALGRICSSRAGNLLICGVAGLCLESYLIQLPLITDRFNGCLIFPLNLIFMTFVIILAAYLCRCGSRLFSQTFAPSSYDWKAIFKL